MPRRPPTRARGDPDPNALFDDDESGEGDSAPLLAADRPAGATDTEVDATSLPFEARLVVEKGDYAGKVLKLGGGTAIVGRSSKCELSLKGSSGVSRRHCKVQLIADRYVVIDLESRNGTVVNGETVARKFLHDGDLLEIGDEHVRFVATMRGGANAAPPPPNSDDIEDQPTALASPLLASLPAAQGGARQQPIKPTPPSNASATTPKRGGDGGTQRKTVPQPKQPPRGAARAAPPVLAPDTPMPPADDTRTASFVMDPAAVFPSARTVQGQSAQQSQSAQRRGDFTDEAPPEPPPLDETSAPYVLQPQKRAGSPVLRVLVVLFLLVFIIVGIAAYDIVAGERRAIAFLRPRAPGAAYFLEQNVPHMQLPFELPSLPGDDDDVATASDAGVASARTASDAGAGAIAGGDVSDAGTPARSDAGAAVVDDARDAGAVVDEVRDAGARVVDEARDAGSKIDASEDGASHGNDVVVVATSGGHVASIKVRVGSVVKKGQTLVLLEGASGLRKKLDALREEERDFEQAVKKGNKSAKRDLDQVREDIAELAKRVRPTPLVSDADGTVVEVLVKDGALIKSGAPLVSLKP